MADECYDVAIVGSGFGGSVTALRLTEKGYRVLVIEAGRRFGPDDYPKSNWSLKDFLYFPKLGLKGIQRIKLLKNVLVLAGAGVGGGSLVYANTLYEPLDGFYENSQWAHITDWRSELRPYYDQAKRMLGVTTASDNSASDQLLAQVGENLGVGHTYRPSEVGVFFDRPGQKTADPFFGGEGPDRYGCIECGACMIGCKHGAKNSLDQNYLYLAERAGAEVLAERHVIEVAPLDSGHYRLRIERPGLLARFSRDTVVAEQVVFSAGVMGTVELLANMKSRQLLANISDRLGDVVRTNSESIVGASRNKVDPQRDYSKGIAISSSIYPDEHTHIEAVKYPAGSNAMGMLAVPLVEGGTRTPRWLKFVWSSIARPKNFLSSLWLARFSERSVLLLVMQSLDNSMSLRWKPNRRLRSKLYSVQTGSDANPTYIPVAAAAAKEAASILGGIAGCSVNEALLNRPVTAHILGGCIIGDNPETGVVDPYQRLYGHPGLHVADGSTISSNLGVNPSLSIAAQTERAMAMWPNKGDRDPRPALGSPYRPVLAVSPKNPVVPVDASAALQW